MIPADPCLPPNARSGAHGFRSHRLRSLLVLCKYCRIRARVSGPSCCKVWRPFFVSALAVKPVDVTGAIEFLEKAGLDELCRIRCFGCGYSVAYVLEDRLEAFHGRVRFGPHDFTQGLISFV